MYPINLVISTIKDVFGEFTTTSVFCSICNKCLYLLLSVIWLKVNNGVVVDAKNKVKITVYFLNNIKVSSRVWCLIYLPVIESQNLHIS